MSDDGQGFVIREGLVIRPGDSLLLRVEGHMSDEQFDVLHASLRKRLRGLDQLVILEGVEDWAIYRPDPATEDIGEATP